MDPTSRPMRPDRLQRPLHLDLLLLVEDARLLGLQRGGRVPSQVHVSIPVLASLGRNPWVRPIPQEPMTCWPGRLGQGEIVLVHGAFGRYALGISEGNS